MMKSAIVIFTFSVILLVITSCSSSKNVAGTTTVERNAIDIEAAATAEGRDGMTFEKAIVVNSIKEEYKWIEAKYPGSRVEGQALIRKNGKPYDVLTFVTKEGEKKEAHFDISSFFGKGF